MPRFRKLRQSLVATVPDALDMLTPEGRLNIYQILALLVVMRSDGGVEASGRFVNNLSVCTPEPAQA